MPDKTGTTGRFDVKLEWTRDDAGGADDGLAGKAPSLFTALQEQLGLKLESAKGPVDVLVVEQIEPPSAN